MTNDSSSRDVRGFMNEASGWHRSRVSRVSVYRCSSGAFLDEPCTGLQHGGSALGGVYYPTER